MDEETGCISLHIAVKSHQYVGQWCWLAWGRKMIQLKWAELLSQIQTLVSEEQ